MTGPEHHREAERIMTELTLVESGEAQELAFPEAMAIAQVHATLAVAAAIEAGSGSRGRPEFPRPEIGPLLPDPRPPGPGPLPWT